MKDQGAHRRRREAYMRALGPHAIALVASPPAATRNGDAQYRYRQSSDLYYLTGFEEEQSVLVLRPGAKDQRVVLFNRPRDAERETWDGRRSGQDGAVVDFGVEVSYPIDDLDERLPELLSNFDDLHYSVGIDQAFDLRVLSTIANLRQRERRGHLAPTRIIDPKSLLHELRLKKNEDELETLRKAAAITAEAHIAAMAHARPGVFEYELEATLDYTFRRRGGMGSGYSSIVGAGDNATILHYIENDKALRDGDLVLIDAGCEYQHYTADVTRTFPASGTFSEPQRAIYSAVLAAQKAAISMVRPGVTLDEIHQRCIEILTEAMVDLGFFDGPASARIADQSYKRYYMHRTSHWLGLDVHDVGAYSREGAPRPLEPGMVLTIEPGFYVAKDDELAPEAYRGIGVRIEDDVVVTAAGCENLTGTIPKEVNDVEKACRSTEGAT